MSAPSVDSTVWPSFGLPPSCTGYVGYCRLMSPLSNNRVRALLASRISLLEGAVNFPVESTIMHELYKQDYSAVKNWAKEYPKGHSFKTMTSALNQILEGLDLVETVLHKSPADMKAVVPFPVSTVDPCIGPLIKLAFG